MPDDQLAKLAESYAGRRPEQESLTLEGAVADALLLLAYASRHGIKLEREVMAAIVASEHRLREGPLNEEQELAFWTNHRALARAVHPVTVASVKATLDPNPDKRNTLWLLLRRRQISEARWAVFKYRWLALLFLVILICAQMFWVVGASLTSEVVEINREIQQLRGERALLRDELGEAAGGDRRIGTIDSAIAERQGWLVGAYFNLHDWNRIWASITHAVPFLKSPFANEGFESLPLNVRNRIEVTSAEFVLQALSAYVLPLFYGLLGAFAYVLRDVSREIRAVTFSPDSTIRYSLRLSLGLLSGIAVGLFLTPSDGPGDAASGGDLLTLKTLSPLGLAFLAGYAVELIFAAMDRIVGAFTGGGGPNRDRRGEAPSAGG